MIKPTRPFREFRLSSDTRLFSCVDRNWTESHLGARNSASRRFTPIKERDGGDRLARTIYVGETMKCALGETVFRDLQGGGVVHKNRLHNRGIIEIAVPRPAVLADLRSIAARAIGCSKREWGGAPGTWEARHYRSSQHLGKLVFEATTQDGEQFDGVAWSSNQDNTQTAFVLFTDRVAPVLLESFVSLRKFRDEVGQYATDLQVDLPAYW